MSRTHYRICSSILLLWAGSGLHADEIRHQIAPGIVHTQELLNTPQGPLVCNILRADLKQPGVHTQTAIAREVILNDEPAKGREQLGILAARHHAIAAINGDFFPYTGDPLGIAIRDGELLSEGMPNRVAIGINRDGKITFDTLLSIGTLFAADGASISLDGINRIAAKDEVVIETPAFGDKARCPANSTCVVIASPSLPVKVGVDLEGIAGPPIPGDANSPVPALSCVLIAAGNQARWVNEHVHAGDKIRFRFDFVRNLLPPGSPNRGAIASRAAAARTRPIKSEWMDVEQSIGGGPWLVRDGKVTVDGDEEGFSSREFVLSRHPRSAAGVTAGGELLLVTVDGRQSFSMGMSLPELAAYMLKIGAVNAINLDGGGSSMMVVKDRYVNGPSDGEPRAIADALLLFGIADESPEKPIPAAVQDIEPVKITAGQKMAVSVPPALITEGESPFWGTIEGLAFVNQQGLLTGTHAGVGTLSVTTKAGDFKIPYTIEASSPASLTAALAAAPNNPPDRSVLTVRVTDSYKNGIKGQSVKINAIGGTPDKPELFTDATGRATVEIVWDVQANRRAVVSSGTLIEVTVRPK